MGNFIWRLYNEEIMRKVVSKEVTAGGRFDFFLDSRLSISQYQK